MNLHPSEFERPSKTGLRGETVKLGGRPAWRWVGEVLGKALEWRKTPASGRAGQLRRGGAVPEKSSLLRATRETWAASFRVRAPQAQSTCRRRRTHTSAASDTEARRAILPTA